MGEWRYSSSHSLTSALDGDEWSASLSGSFTPRETSPGTHWIGGWVGPRAVLDAVVKRKFPSPRRESNPYWGLNVHVLNMNSVYTLLNPEDGGSTDHRNTGIPPEHYTTLQHRRHRRESLKTHILGIFRLHPVPTFRIR
jgi:hypothetical protein